MFVLKQTDTYFWPVTVEIPASGGKFDRHTFDAEFKRVAQSRLRELGLKIQADEISDEDLCREVLMGWKGVNDEHGQPMPFSETTRDQLLDVQLVAAAIVKAFLGSFAGAKAKN